MRFLIDGYNLMHAIWPGEGRHLKARAWPRFRQRLLDRVRAKADPGSVTIVFDANHSPPDAPAEEYSHGIHVRFAVGYPSADDLIEELLRTESSPKGLTVVSDDHRLRDAARRRGCHVSGCLDYIESLDRPATPVRDADEPSAKPEQLSPDEVQRWLTEFGDPGRAG
jgi:uncharacterized protein